MSGMEATRRFLANMGLPAGDEHDLPSSPQRFPDGGQWRVEIPSVEGPNALRMVYAAADEYGVPVHRVSQGSGVMLLTDAELDEMAALGRERGIEISLFVGPRAGWDTGAMAYSTAGRIVAPKVRGMDQLVQAVGVDPDMAKVKAARGKADGLHKANKEEECEKSLAEAQKLLGIKEPHKN